MASCVCVFGRAGRQCQWWIWGLDFGSLELDVLFGMFGIDNYYKRSILFLNLKRKEEIHFVIVEISCQTEKSKECDLLFFTETLFSVNYNLHVYAQHILECSFLHVLGTNYFLVSSPTIAIWWCSRKRFIGSIVLTSPLRQRKQFPSHGFSLHEGGFVEDVQDLSDSTNSIRCCEKAPIDRTLFWSILLFCFELYKKAKKDTSIQEVICRLYYTKCELN